MKALGYAAIDTIIEHFENVPRKSVHNQRTPAYLRGVIGDKLPDEGQSPFELLNEAKEHIFSSIMHVDHPRFYSFIPSPSNFVSFIGDLLATGFNVFNGHWLAGSGPAEVERITIDWLKEICGFPKGAGGLFLSGGSMANLSAIAIARNIILGAEDKLGVVYYSQQTHSSLAKGLKVLGIGAKYRRPISVDSNLKIDINQLRLQIERDIKQGLTPFCIVGNAGTTNAGVVDPLAQMASLAQKYKCWFHIDGAYGAAAMLSESAKPLLKGIEKADSLTLDPHKWWFQPMEMGCLLVRQASHLKDTFRVNAEYLADTKGDEIKEINFYDHGIQLTRSFRALKLYFSLKAFGLQAFRQAVENGMAMAVYAEQLLRQKKDWQIITPAQLGIVNFVFAPLNASKEEISNYSKQVSDRIVKDGFTMIITTKIHGQTVLRICPIHPALTKRDIEQTIDLLVQFAKEITEEKN